MGAVERRETDEKQPILEETFVLGEVGYHVSHCEVIDGCPFQWRAKPTAL